MAFGYESFYFTGPAYDKEVWGKIGNVSFWQTLNPDLTLSEFPLARCSSYSFPREEILKFQRMLKQDGYFQTEPVLPSTLTALLSNAIRKLIHNGIHPIFAMVYDEFWQVLQNLSGLVHEIARDDFRIQADFWIWVVSPRHAPAGWSPHRDHQEDEPFFPDGSPSLINLWIALTDADPSNGCIYVLPKSLDPNLPEHPEVREVPQIQNIMALPAAAGSILGWDQHLLHWGGRCCKHTGRPRISLACYYQSASLPSRLDTLVESGAKLSLVERLSYISSALLRYDHEFKFPAELIRVAERYQSIRDFFSIQNLSDFKKLFGQGK